MKLRIWRFTAVLLTALSMGLSIAHLFEMPVRLQLAPELWVRITVIEGIFRYFGSVGAVIELGSVVSAAVLAILTWKRRRTVSLLATAGAICITLALLNWFIFVASANVELARWLTGPVAADFEGWRRQWEFGHAASAILKLIGFALLTASVVWDRSDP